MAYTTCTVPAGGKISITNGKLSVPENPIVPFIRGDGTGPDIWASSVRVFDAAVAKAYGGKRKVSWFEVFAGEESFKKFNNWLPDDTVDAFREYLVGIKGPLTTPVGGGIRSLNVALRQMLDLYVCKSVTIVHKGNIMKYTEGAFRDWSYGLAKSEFGAVEIDGGPWCQIPEGKPGAGIIIKDAIADIALQQVLTRPTDFDVIATLNLNGDYLSDALAAQVGGIGIAPGGNINYLTGHAIFEATHGTAPKYANKDMVNPGSVVLSGEMMFRYLGWTEVADLIIKGLNGAIGSKKVTYDFARLMEGATEIKCSAFGENIIAHM